jgi:hypothetical protein
MVQVETLLAFIVIGIVWGASDAFMEVGIKQPDNSLTKLHPQDDDVEKMTKKKT